MTNPPKRQTGSKRRRKSFRNMTPFCIASNNKLSMHGSLYPTPPTTSFFMLFYVRSKFIAAAVCIGLGLALILTAPTTPEI